MLRGKRGQSTAEYAIVIGLVIAAAVAMQTYVKRGIQAKIKGVVDYAPSGPIGFTGDQFEPNYASSNMDTTREREETTTMKETGEVTRSLAGKEITLRKGVQKTSGLSESGTPIP